MFNPRKCTLDRKISTIGNYPLLEYYDGYKIPIVSDSMFKTMINNESRMEYICYLISALFDEDYNEVLNNTTFIKTELDKVKKEESKKTVDLLCKIKGKIINVEVNNNTSKSLLERNLAYMFSLYHGDMKEGSKYRFNNIIQVNINNFRFSGKKDVLEECYITNIRKLPKDINDFDIYSNKIRIINIYLPNINKKEYNKLKLYEKLLLIFNENDEELLNDLSEGDEIMEKYVKESKEASEKDEVIGMYNEELHKEKLRLAEIDEFRELGHEEGLKEGLEKGMQQGTKKTKEETAKKMLQEGLDISIISRCTDLSIEEVEKLKEVE
jgi:predicted transposase/invertase (TIGR01784 family)